MTPPRQKKKREINWQAVEHVGNDADEGGFLGNEEAERERSGAKPVAVVPSPASEQAARPEVTAAPIDAPATAAAGPGAELSLTAGSQATSAGTTETERGGADSGTADISTDQLADGQVQGALKSRSLPLRRRPLSNRRSASQRQSQRVGTQRFLRSRRSWKLLRCCFLLVRVVLE